MDVDEMMDWMTRDFGYSCGHQRIYQSWRDRKRFTLAYTFMIEYQLDIHRVDLRLL